MRFTNTITIDRHPDDVFAYLADLENLPRWNYAIRATRKVSAGPVGVGSRYEQVRTIPVEREEELEVVEYDAGRRLSVRGTLNNLPARLSYVLRREAGTTVLVNTVDLSTPGPLGLVAPFATRQVRSAVAANLDQLRKILERG